jgi:serine protease Do
MFEQKEKDTASGNSKRSRKLRQYLLCGVAAAALIAAVPAVYDASADTPVLQKNEAPGTLTLNQNAVGLPDFTQLVKRVRPAVVSVRVKQAASAQLTPGNNDNPFKGTPFEQFFRDFRGENGGHWKQVRPIPMEAQGSGFFISDGYIVTNNHVVDDASEVEVVTNDGQTLKAKVVGKDQKTDLALIKVDSDKKFPFVTLSKEKPEIGQWVVAMGNPFGLGGTVTAGIISAEGRDIGEGPYDDFLQIDAPINRGNSGGPTFNMKGEVIGVNTAIYSPSGGSIGIAFDIPASTVESVIPQLQKAGYVRRGWLGVQIQPVTKAIADSLGLKEAKGALISKPQPDSPAAEAGLKSGDIVTSLDNASVKDARELARKVATIAPGSVVTLGIVRDGKPETVTLKIGQMKEQNVRNASAGQNDREQMEKLGLQLAPANEVKGEGSKGVVIVGVEPGGEAANLGLAEGDVILKAGGKSVSTPSELKEALQAARTAGRSYALILVKHENSEVYVPVPVSAG